MPRILLMVAILVLVVGGLIAFLARMNVGQVNEAVKTTVENVLPNTSSTSQVLLPSNNSKSNFNKAEFLAILEASISALNKRIDGLAARQVAAPVTQTQSSSTQTSSPKTLYIPLGYGGSSTSNQDFANISGTEVTIDPANYPGYKQMVFEANMRIFQGNGKGEARIGNKTDGTAITGSVVSTTSQDYSLQTSGGFSLPSGSKKYVVQLKSSTGYAVDLQLTRIRVDF